jgi:hypothetical protein
VNPRQIAAYALLVVFIPFSVDARGFGGGGAGGGGFRGGGGFDMHSEAPSGGTHSSTGPAGTSRTTAYGSTANGAGRTTTATNGSYSKTTSAGASGGQYNKNSTASNGYASKSSSTSANSNTGNYSRSASGSNATGSYNTQTSGNAYNHTAEHTTNASNVYGQSYHGATTANNGYVTHGAYGSSAYYGGTAYVVNPVYGAYPAWGWNTGVAWYPAPNYWGGGFWGPWALGVATAAAWGTVVYEGQTMQSYQVQSDTPGAKLLASYKLTQTPCGPPGLVVIYGPDKSAICARPNNMVSAGAYNVDASNLTIVSTVVGQSMPAGAQPPPRPTQAQVQSALSAANLSFRQKRKLRPMVDTYKSQVASAPDEQAKTAATQQLIASMKTVLFPAQQAAFKESLTNQMAAAQH